jgi:MFS transporter, DHA2 family, multidrug resistance protein
MPPIYASRVRGWRFLLLNLALGLGHIVVLSNVGGYAVIIPYVAASLGGVLPSFAVWGNSDFLASIAIGFAMSRWFSDRYGEYRTLLAAFLFFAVASYFCAVSESLWLFLPSRIALGLAGGVTLPAGQAMLLDEYPERERSLALAIWGLFTLMPVTIGIPLGGWFNEHLGWRFVLYSNVGVALIVAGVLGALLYGRGFRRRYVRFDTLGATLFVATLLGVQTILNQANDFDWFGWSWFMRGVLFIVLVALPSFVIWELTERRPMLDISLFAHRNYAIATICATLGFLFIQGLISMFVTQLQLLLGYSSVLAGAAFTVMIPLSVPLVSVAHRLCESLDARLVCSLNLIGLSFVMFWIGEFDDPSDFEQIFWPMVLFGALLATFFAPLGVLALHDMPKRRLLRAAEEFSVLRTAAGAFGIALMGVVQFRRAPFHQLDLADHFGGRRFASLELLPALTAKLEAAGLSPAMAQAYVGRLIKNEAVLLGLNDAFLLASWFFLALAALVWLARPTHLTSRNRARKLRELRAVELTEQP